MNPFSDLEINETKLYDDNFVKLKDKVIRRGDYSLCMNENCSLPLLIPRLIRVRPDIWLLDDPAQIRLIFTWFHNINLCRISGQRSTDNSV